MSETTSESSQIQWPEIDELATALDKLGYLGTPFEAHGSLCGLMCMQPTSEASDWLKYNSDEADLNDAMNQQALEWVKQLHVATVLSLSDSNLEFYLFLPDDDEELMIRTEALGQWCQGYLLGLSQGGLKDLKELPEEAEEVARDMLSISQAGSYELADDEVDEAAYMELEEYVRVGVLLVNELINPSKAAPHIPDGVSHESDQLH